MKNLFVQPAAGDAGGSVGVAHYVYNTLEKHKIIAEALQQMWRKNLGVDITLVNEEWKVYIDDQHSKNFQFERWITR